MDDTLSITAASLHPVICKDRAAVRCIGPHLCSCWLSPHLLAKGQAAAVADGAGLDASFCTLVCLPSSSADINYRPTYLDLCLPVPIVREVRAFLTRKHEYNSAHTPQQNLYSSACDTSNGEQ